MNRGRNRIGGLFGFAAAAMAVMAAAPALEAQQTTPTPAPAPAPAPAPSRTPSVIYLPNVQPERFTLGTPAATPTPTTPAPTPAPTAAAPATAPARTTPVRTAPASRPIQAAPAPAPTQAAPAAIVPTPSATEAPAAAPIPLPDAAASPAPAEPAPAGTPAWLWVLLGAGGAALIFGAVWALRRRRPEPGPEALAVPAAAPPPPAPPRRVAPPPGIAPAPAAAPSGEPFEILLQPQRIEVAANEVLLDFELMIGNVQGSAAENIRVSLAMMSASPDQDRHIAGYHANPVNDPGGAPFDLAAGAGGRMPARLALPREFIHVVDLGGRPMFVPMVMVELKWRSGISIRRFGADFMVGKAGQGAKLGPIWLDRNQQAGQLAATRYLPRQAAAA